MEGLLFLSNAESILFIGARPRREKLYGDGYTIELSQLWGKTWLRVLVVIGHCEREKCMPVENFWFVGHGLPYIEQFHTW